MITQTILPFKLEMTNETITPHAGLIIFGEFANGLGLPKIIRAEMPKPKSAAGYNAEEYIIPMVLMLNGGGQSLEDIREIRQDDGMRELLKLETIPSSDACGDWLRRMGKEDGMEGLRRINNKLIKTALRRDEIKEYTLDIDATGIHSEKETAKKTYKGYKGYMPMVGHLAENGLVIGEEFREGNESPSTENYEFIQYCISQMPEGKSIKYVRADSAAYQAKIMNYCEANGITFAIGADLDASVVKAIEAISEDEWKQYEDGYIAETTHTMNKTDNAFRLVIIKRPVQADMLLNENKPHYALVASNMEDKKSSEEVVKWYNQRGEYSENKIKELKNGIGMNRMPCGDFAANAVFFRIGIMAYNLFRIFQLKVLSSEWSHRKISTIRWKLYNVAGRIVYHANQLILKVKRFYRDTFAEIRIKIYEFVYDCDD